MDDAEGVNGARTIAPIQDLLVSMPRNSAAAAEDVVAAFGADVPVSVLQRDDVDWYYWQVRNTTAPPTRRSWPPSSAAPEPWCPVGPPSETSPS